jgi:hypothetical protein
MTRANTERPDKGGGHTDALESGMPSDRKSEGAGPAGEYQGIKPSSSPNRLEKGDYPEPGDDTAGGGAHNHRILPPPSAEDAGGRGSANAKGVIGDGRGLSGKFCGTMGDGAKGEPKGKGYVGG